MSWGGSFGGGTLDSHDSNIVDIGKHTHSHGSVMGHAMVIPRSGVQK